MRHHYQVGAALNAAFGHSWIVYSIGWYHMHFLERRCWFRQARLRSNEIKSQFNEYKRDNLPLQFPWLSTPGGISAAISILDGSAYEPWSHAMPPTARKPLSATPEASVGSAEASEDLAWLIIILDEIAVNSTLESDPGLPNIYYQITESKRTIPEHKIRIQVWSDRLPCLRERCVSPIIIIQQWNAAIATITIIC